MRDLERQLFEIAPDFEAKEKEYKASWDWFKMTKQG